MAIKRRELKFNPLIPMAKYAVRDLDATNVVDFALQCRLHNCEPLSRKRQKGWSAMCQVAGCPHSQTDESPMAAIRKWNRGVDPDDDANMVKELSEDELDCYLHGTGFEALVNVDK